MIRRPMTGSARRGFTLVELMVVIIVLAVVAGMIVPQFGGTHRKELLRSTARRLIQVMKLASSQAVTSHRPCRFRLEPATGRYWIEAPVGDGFSQRRFEPLESVPGASGIFDKRVTVRILRSAEIDREPADEDDPGGSFEVIPFHADGTSAAREILLRDAEDSLLVLRLNPTTSRVRVVDPDRARVRTITETEAES